MSTHLSCAESETSKDPTDLSPVVFQIPQSPTTPDEVDYFMSFPWCAKPLQDPNTIVIPKSVREAERDKIGENSLLFMHNRLATEDTIHNDLSFYRLPLAEANRFPARTPGNPYDVGKGVSSWKGTAHGGFAATLLDETSG